MTNRDFYVAVLEMNVSDEMNAMAEKFIGQLDRKGTVSEKVAEERLEQTAEILAVMTENVGITASDIAKALTYKYSTSKIVALLKNVPNVTATKEKAKSPTVYTLING